MNFKPESDAPCDNQDLVADPFLPHDNNESEHLLGQVLAGTDDLSICLNNKLCLKFITNYRAKVKCLYKSFQQFFFKCLKLHFCCTACIILMIKIFDFNVLFCIATPYITLIVCISLYKTVISNIKLFNLR